MARVVLFTFLSALVLAGCVTPTPDGTQPGSVLDPVKAVAYDGAWNVAPSPATLAGYDVFDTLHAGAEPTMGVTAKGTLFVVSGKDVLRSRDNGTTWQTVSPPANFPTTLDPFLWVDQDTGRVFLNHLYVGCSYLAFTDDEGASWIFNPIACGLPGNDHQTVATGKPVNVAVPMPLYKNVVYYGYNGVAFSAVARSLDGGLTFAGAVIAIGPENCGGLNGHLKAAPDGTLYLPAAGCDEPVVAVSRDSGVTWENHVIKTDGIGRSTPGDDPSITLDTEGNAYFVWPGKDAHMYGSVSTDKGKTWSAPSRISPPQITSSLMPAAIAGAPGKVAFAYYATEADVSKWKSANSDDAAEDARWDLYVTYSEDALRGVDATFVTVRVTPDDNPVQIGRIHNGGSDGTPDRNLLDFFDAQRDTAGRVYISYTDGCHHKCTGKEKVRERQTTVAVMRDGPRLL